MKKDNEKESITFSTVLKLCPICLFAVGAGLKDLLAFWAGWEIIPAQGENLIVQLDDTKPASSLVESQACFNKLILSSANMEYSTFKTLMSKALKFGYRGYTNI